MLDRLPCDLGDVAPACVGFRKCRPSPSPYRQSSVLQLKVEPSALLTWMGRRAVTRAVKSTEHLVPNKNKV
jgi:hypothetical protein